MSGSGARREIGRLAIRGDWPNTRGQRFCRRGEALPSFAALHALPRWPVLDAAGQERVATVALLVAGQSALARTIDGARLRDYATLVGADVLERAMTHGEGGRDPLPLADRMPDAARRLLATSAANVDATRALTIAETLLKEADAWPST